MNPGNSAGLSVPTVSIGLPVYNGCVYLDRAVASILGQEFEDLELIIADNASTDETESICRAWSARDTRVRYYRNEENLGAARNYNKVFALARGRYFKWAAYDDECHPAMIGRCVEYLERAPESVSMVYPLGELIDEQGKRLRSPLDRIECTDLRPHRRLARLLRTLAMCDPVFGLIRVGHLRQTRLIGSFFAADYVLLGELAMLGEIRELNEVLFRLRAHPRRSMKANRNARERAAWFDPAAARRLLVMPGWERMIWELLGSTRRMPLPQMERFCCALAVLGTHYWRRFKTAGGRFKRRLRGEATDRPMTVQDVR